MGKAFLPCLVSITSPSSLANLDMPKSAILHSLLWSTRTFLAARSRWMICAERTKSPMNDRHDREVHVPLRVRLLTVCPHDGELHAITSSARPSPSVCLSRKTQPWARARARQNGIRGGPRRTTSGRAKYCFSETSNINPPMRARLLESEIWED